MKICTWNINSVRLRIGLVLDLIKEAGPDIICLQETKTPDEHFPSGPLVDAGYEHIHFHGMKGYNGVAIISKLPFTHKDIHHRVGREDCRHIEAHFCMPSSRRPEQQDPRVRGDDVRGGGDDAKGGGDAGGTGFHLHNLYIPAGGDEPDPDVNDKYKHKLDFVEEMAGWFADRYSAKDRVVAVGDFNIAPGEHDVWSHKQLLKVVSHTPPELERIEAMRASLDFVDSARAFIPEDEKAYSWWSYRNRDWKKSNRGRRLDHIWVSPPLKSSLRSYEALSHARDWEKPSDHVPVIVDLAL